MGEDGFFLVRPVRYFWLTVSAWLRRLHFDRIIHWLPGVRRHEREARTLAVDPHTARWLAVEIFRLLGFRRYRSEGGKWVLTRRPYD